MRLALIAFVSAALCFGAAPVLAEPEPFELRDGDRVALVGSTLIEREQRYGHWEAALTARWPDRNIIFRNLAWSGDTVWGDARAAFDTAKEGYERLIKMVEFVKPTVIIVCYGQNEAFAGEAGLAKFKEGYNRLLDDLEKTKARLLLVSPQPLESLGAPMPDPADHNRDLASYGGAIKEIASERGHNFADFFAAFGGAQGLQVADSKGPFTGDQITLTEQGYRATAPIVAKLLDPQGHGSSAAPSEDLRAAIVEKNRHFFNRWRPQNETYLFGFRKHEQGQNAKEIPQFDPLIEEAERKIAELRVPKPHTYELRPAGEEQK